MANVFPDAANGGIEVREPDGTPIPVTNVPNAYVPAPEFSVSCSFTYLADDCFSRVAPAQINAIVSEMICFAEGLNPDGEWDCASLCNIRTAFETWVENFQSGQIGDQLCGLPDGTGREAGARFIYCVNGNAMAVPLEGEDSILSVVLDALCGSPIENSTTPGTTLLYCDGNGDIKKLTLGSIQLFRGEHVQSYTYTTNMMVRKNGKLYSPNAAIPANTPFEIGTTGATWYEVSPAGAAPPFDPTINYPKNTIVNIGGSYFAANEDIPAGTPFEVGTTGLTWRQVDLTQAFILEHDPTIAYRQFAVVSRNGTLYRATNGDLAPGPFNVNSWEVLGGERNIYRGKWVQANAFRLDDVVEKDLYLYAANAAVPAGTLFAVGTTGATWRLLGTRREVEISFSASGGWGVNETWLLYPVRGDSFVLPANLAGSKIAVISGTAVDTTLSMRKNGVEFGTVIFTASVPVVTAAQTTFTDGDTFSLTSTSGSVFDAIGFNLIGNKV